MNVKKFCFHVLRIRHKAYGKFAWRSLSSEPRVVEIGNFDTPIANGGRYEIGQTFLHRLFDYRGVILYPWITKVYDRDLATKTNDRTMNDKIVGETDVKGKKHMYYQVLIDERDVSHVCRWLQTEMTYLENKASSNSLIAIPASDFVAHEDVLPFTAVDKYPIEHKILDDFLTYESDLSPHYAPKDSAIHHHWFSHRLYEVHKETTENIRVTVIPIYMGHYQKQHQQEYLWRYCIRLENLGSETVQLRQRKWNIHPLAGNMSRQRGRGVVGKEPVLSKEIPFFQYSSHVSLESQGGYMSGTFLFEREDQSTFEVKIPNFPLLSMTDFDSTHGFMDSS